MFAADHNAHTMGMSVTSIAPGEATVEMTVTAAMANGFDVCHGGVIFTLADTAMAYASNSRGGTNLAAGASIDFVAPARVGETLIARAHETHQTGRTGFYAATVTASTAVVAIFHGRTKRIADEGLGA